MSEDRGVNRANPDDLLDAEADPAGQAFNTLGNEAGSDLNWFRMVRSRVQARAEGSSRYRWWVLWSLLAGLFALNFTFTVFIVALPKVAGEFHTSVTVLTWTMVGPLLAYGLAAPVFGKVGDIWSHRHLYLFGLIGAMVSAILTAMSHDVAMLLFARTLDGIQGAATGTASGALINLVFPRAERVKAMGWWSLIGAGGPVIGVSLGSPIIQAFGWRALFWFQLTLIITAFIVVAIVLPSKRGTEEEELQRRAKARHDFRRMDWIGSWSMSIMVTTLMLGLSIGPTIGWSAPGTIACFVVSVLMVFGFIYRITHTANPLIPPHYFKNRNFALPMVIRGCANFAYFGAFFLFPLLMEQGYGYSIARVGGLAIARPITFSLCSPIAGYLAMRVGERRMVITGTLALTASMVAFASLHVSTSVWVVALGLALSGLGMGVAMPSSSSIMAYQVRTSEFGVMSAAQLLAMQVGEVAGIQVLETVQQARARAGHLSLNHPGASLLATFHWAFVIGAGVAILGLVAALFVTSVPRGEVVENYDAGH